MTEKFDVGMLGEDIACNYLRSCGYKVLERNVRFPFGEIDIIAQHKNKTLVFVEVKTMNCLSFVNSLKPEDQMTAAKQKKFRRVALAYVASHSQLVRDDKGFQLDVLAIDLFPEGRHEVRHYENAVGE